MTPPSSGSALDTFIRRLDPAYQFSASDWNGTTVLNLTSQEWRGALWSHTLAIVVPDRPSSNRTAILEITGGEINQVDLDRAQRVSKNTGLIVCVLFDIPNQPRWDLMEDELIAHTFDEYLRTGEVDWPLLLPMTKSVIRAMDAVAAFRRSIKNFVVTGSSKRGWTAWLVAATRDKRVLAIAPRVIDALNMTAQMKKQKADWNEFSPMLEPYVERQLPERTATGTGVSLVEIVDPYSYRRRINIPKLLIMGANDAYWTVDAHTEYLDALDGPTWQCTHPNAGHEVGDPSLDSPSFATFAWAMATGAALPNAQITFDGAGTGRRVKCVGSDIERAVLWSATSNDLRFQDKKWSAIANWRPGDGLPLITWTGGKQNEAAFLELEYAVCGRPWIVTSPVKVFRPQSRN